VLQRHQSQHQQDRLPLPALQQQQQLRALHGMRLACCMGRVGGLLRQGVPYRQATS
jgi:hypothetical protein